MESSILNVSDFIKKYVSELVPIVKYVFPELPIRNIKHVLTVLLISIELFLYFIPKGRIIKAILLLVEKLFYTKTIRFCAKESKEEKSKPKLTFFSAKERKIKEDVGRIEDWSYQDISNKILTQMKLSNIRFL